MWGTVFSFVADNWSEILNGALGLYALLASRDKRKERLKSIALETWNKVVDIGRNEEWTDNEYWIQFVREFFSDLDNRGMRMPSGKEFAIIRSFIQTVRDLPKKLHNGNAPKRATERADKELSR